jgi:hypothetical protein
MQDERSERLRRRHNFETWENRGTPVVIGELTLRPDDLPGWQMRRESRNVSLDPPVAKSVWGRGDSVDELLGIELYRSASLGDAHRFLLWFLGEFQSDALEEQQQTGIGDVVFGISEPTMLLFARANYVVHVYNAGPRTTSVIDAAKAIDRKIAAGT